MADKLAKKGSASSQGDYQKIDRVTRSKAPMMAPKLEIPENLYDCINQALEAEQKLKRCTNDEGLLKQLNYLKEKIGSLAEFYKEIGLLPSDWEYKFMNEANETLGNQHIDSAPLVGEAAKAKAARCNYKKLDEKFKADKLAKNHSASSQSDYQKIDRVTPSKEAPELEIPDMLRILPRDRGLLSEKKGEFEDSTSLSNLLYSMFFISDHYMESIKFEIQEMVNILVSEEAY
nr:hypothetical protein [Tanacetum cinerariifolium]